MTIIIRPAVVSDAETCGRICYEGFKAVNEQHGFPPNFPSVEVATRRIQAFIEHPAVFGVVAETERQVVGFAFLSERGPIRAVGPIVIDPAAQGHGIGRRLMQFVLERTQDAPGVRLLQEAFNMPSLSLYAALGFETKELLVAMGGVPESVPLPAWEVRLLEEGHVAGCEA